MDESDAIARLRRIATDPAARGLNDDAAVFEGLVITHDSIAEGVHFLPFDPPASVGWKLVAVNLSDLAAKGASPAGALLSLTISGESEWESEFLTGIEHACESYALPVIGGATLEAQSSPWWFAARRSPGGALDTALPDQLQPRMGCREFAVSAGCVLASISMAWST